MTERTPPRADRPSPPPPAGGAIEQWARGRRAAGLIHGETAELTREQLIRLEAVHIAASVLPSGEWARLLDLSNLITAYVRDGSRP